jgi:hypothetical protein
MSDERAMITTGLRRAARNALEYVGAWAWIGLGAVVTVFGILDDQLQDPEERARRAAAWERMRLRDERRAARQARRGR